MRLLHTILPLALCAFGCDNSAAPDLYDAGNDFSVTTQLTHVGGAAVTCCMVTKGSDFVLYLANPMPGMTDARGHDHPPNGELHLGNPFHDFKLADNVAAYAYGFSADGRWAMYAQKSKTNYSLNFASVEGPDLKMPTIVQVVPDGITDSPLFQQGFFAPSGRYFVVGVLPKNVMNTPDLHIIDIRTIEDVFSIPNGSFAYFETFAPDDTMVFNNSTASTKAGTPSVDGLYVANVPALIGGASPGLIDQHITLTTIMGDGVSVLYVNSAGDLKLFDLQEKYSVQLASNVIAVSAGPFKRGPIVWIGSDRSLHVAPKLGPEILALPAGTVDPGSPINFSPDGTRLYYFKHYVLQDSNGELWTVKLPPGDATPHLVGSRFSSSDFNFVGDRLVEVANVDGYGAAGDMTSMGFDGSGPFVIARGVPVGGIRTANPNPIMMPDKGTKFGPLDLGTFVPPPVFANLTSATRDTMNMPLNQSNSILGALSFGTSIDGPEGVLDPSVHEGIFEFSDDSYVLAYVGGAAWDDTAANYVGTLHFFGTLPGVTASPQTLDGVAELGPIRDKALFVNAPSNATPGVYFIKF
jgi:hypothetical protein